MGAASGPCCSTEGQRFSNIGACHGNAHAESHQRTLARGPLRTQTGALVLDDICTSEFFEVAFDLTPNSSRPQTSSILRLCRSSGMWRYMPAFFFLPGSTRLECRMGRPDNHNATCAIVHNLRIGTRHHVVARLEDSCFTLAVDGESKSVIDGYDRCRYTPAVGVQFWIGDSSNGDPCADALVANVVYTLLGRPGELRRRETATIEECDMCFDGTSGEDPVPAPQRVPLLQLASLHSTKAKRKQQA
eukprot:TRINITY_DN26235_c0_g1_i1.p1 TRINITY_DN26235_c0_g1~~TRINITY_DN26235_c0_g1_i1.p1  ORF type:complete len:269 (+),score=16.80 TRINITY_DN26235_c0_g1_i1:72-809(+)